MTEENEFKRNGYIRFDLSGLSNDPDQKNFLEIKEEFGTLPPDPYAQHLHRYRRYSRAIILPNTDQLIWLPEIADEDNQFYAEYFQGKYNPEYTDSYRKFPALSEKVKSNALLKDIILYDFKQTFWHEKDLIMPIHVGVHFVKLQVDSPDQVGVSSPNCLHQDGETFTFAHLIHRQNAIGGVNVIAPPDCAGKMPEDVLPESLYETFILTKPLESYGVCDEKVSHYVSAIQQGEEPISGVRSMLLIDFLPTIISPGSATSCF
jgi:hypothetical protein